MTEGPNRPPAPLGARLRSARERQCLSRREVVEKLAARGYSKPDATEFYRWEEKGVVPRPERLYQLCEVLGISVGDVLAPARRNGEAA